MKLRPQAKTILFVIIFVSWLLIGWKLGLFDPGTKPYMPRCYENTFQEIP